MVRVTQAHLDARRRQILDAAKRCFARNGFHATSMQDIFNEADLSAGAVYRYFNGKDEIIGAIAAETLAAVRELFARSDAVPASLGKALELMFISEQRLADTEQIGTLAIQAWTEALRNRSVSKQLVASLNAKRNDFADIVRIYQARGAVACDVSPESVAIVLVALMHGFLVQYAIAGDVNAQMFATGTRALLGGGLQMKVSDIKCGSCGAGYRHVETVSLSGSSTTHQFNCACGTVIEVLGFPKPDHS